MLLTRFNNISLFAVTVSFFLIVLSKTLFSDSVKDLERLKLENIEKLCLNSLSGTIVILDIKGNSDVFWSIVKITLKT